MEECEWCGLDQKMEDTDVPKVGMVTSVRELLKCPVKYERQ